MLFIECWPRIKKNDGQDFIKKAGQDFNKSWPGFKIKAGQDFRKKAGQVFK